MEITFMNIISMLDYCISEVSVGLSKLRAMEWEDFDTTIPAMFQVEADIDEAILSIKDIIVFVATHDPQQEYVGNRLKKATELILEFAKEKVRVINGDPKP